MRKAGFVILVIIIVGIIFYLSQSPPTINETIEKAKQDLASVTHIPPLPQVLQPSAGTTTTTTNQTQQQPQQGKPFTGRVVDVKTPWGSSKSDTQLNFSPALVRINVGDTVTWTNYDDERHTVTSGTKFDKQWGTIFDSGIITGGSKYSFTFTAVGDYPYLCALHPWMSGGVQVRQP